MVVLGECRQRSDQSIRVLGKHCDASRQIAVGHSSEPKQPNDFVCVVEIGLHLVRLRSWAWKVAQSALNRVRFVIRRHRCVGCDR